MSGPLSIRLSPIVFKMLAKNQSPKESFARYVRTLQDEICLALEALDEEAVFVEDQWDRDGGGGGWTRIMDGGRLFEKAGVNVSAVHGTTPEVIKNQVPESAAEFYATGISLVIHPFNPMIPTVHANFRFFQLMDTEGNIVDGWFGGGADLTPYYLFEEDAVHFHQTLKDACDRHDPSHYPKFKDWCDRYFRNHHRKEQRGIGGLFFDHLRLSEDIEANSAHQAFVEDAGNAFLPAYLPIVEQRQSMPYTPEQKKWQEIRRGRYVEFNLIHDRGTLFGLKSNGRIESIFMSLPPTVRWAYDLHPEPGSPEAKLMDVLYQPKAWV